MAFLARAPNRFPLQIHASGRYFIDQAGTPFYFLLDAGWEAAVQLTREQIDTYLNDRASRGFTAIILEMTTLLYSNQNPTYINAYGDSPYATITAQGVSPFGASACDFSSAGGNYWNNVDYIIAGAKARSMVVVAFPAYVGFPTTPRQGWIDCLTGDTAAHLQSYGAFIQNRYGSYGNIIWGMSGDNSLSQANLDQNWNIVTGMRTVRTDQLIYVKGQRDTSGYSLLTTNGGTSRYPGFNVNNAYVANANASYTAASDSLTEYGRSPVYPFFVDETDYEGYSGVTARDVRFGLIAPRLSGACGDCFGNGGLQVFLSPNNSPFPSTGPAAALTSTYLATNGAQHSTNWSKLVTSYSWWLLVPKTDTSLVTTSLGTGNSTICPALASDGTFALIYTAGGTGFTVNLAALSVGSVRARWWDPTANTFTTATGSPFANTGTHAFTTPGNNAGGDVDWVLVLD